MICSQLSFTFQTGAQCTQHNRVELNWIGLGWIESPFGRGRRAAGHPLVAFAFGCSGAAPGQSPVGPPDTNRHTSSALWARCCTWTRYRGFYKKTKRKQKQNRKRDRTESRKSKEEERAILSVANRLGNWITRRGTCWVYIWSPVSSHLNAITQTVVKCWNQIRPGTTGASQTCACNAGRSKSVPFIRPIHSSSLPSWKY